MIETVLDFHFWPLWTTSTRIATSDSSIYPPTNTPPCAVCVPTSNKSTIKPTAKPYAPTATAVKPSSKSSPETHSTQTPPVIMLKTATSPAWTMRWMKWKSNTVSIICSIRANASNGCLHACANKSIKIQKGRLKPYSDGLYFFSLNPALFLPATGLPSRRQTAMPSGLNGCRAFEPIATRLGALYRQKAH